MNIIPAATKLLTSLFIPQAAFDPRVKASFCWFATDIHSATLGKGKNDDTLARVKKGDMTGKGELVVRTIALHDRQACINVHRPYQ